MRLSSFSTFTCYVIKISEFLKIFFGKIMISSTEKRHFQRRQFIYLQTKKARFLPSLRTLYVSCTLKTTEIHKTDKKSILLCIKVTLNKKPSLVLPPEKPTHSQNMLQSQRKNTHHHYKGSIIPVPVQGIYLNLFFVHHRILHF